MIYVFVEKKGKKRSSRKCFLPQVGWSISALGVFWQKWSCAMMPFHNRGFVFALVIAASQTPLCPASIRQSHQGSYIFLICNFRKAWITKMQFHISHKSSVMLSCSAEADFQHRWHFLVGFQVVFVPWDTMCPKNGGGGELLRQSGRPTTGRMNHVCPPLSFSVPTVSWKCWSQDQGSASPHCFHRQGFNIRTNAEKPCFQEDFLKG